MTMAGSSYQSFAEIGDENHVLIHVLPSDSKGPSSWQNHIHDLDDFFTKVYNYHQRSGFTCIVVNQILELIQFIFVVLFTIFLFHCVDYNMLFKNLPKPNKTKVTIADCVLPPKSIEFNHLEIILLTFAVLFFLIRLVQVIQSIFVNLSIKQFYHEALHISDCSMFTWQDVQTRLIQAQHLCLIQDGQLNELDIHNRILRRHNYMIALVNRGLLPIHYKIPILGEIIYLSKGLQFNVYYLLFDGYFSLFENSWKLKDTIKIASQRQVCADALARNCLLLAVINIVLLPLILIWQTLYTFYMYAEGIKRDPSMALGSRNWSLYTRWYCRHFNELDHQLNDRLNRCYKAATKYMNSFTSPLMEIIAKHIAFIAGAMLAVLLALTIYDEDVITVEHLITVVTALGGIIALCRTFISSEIPSRYTHAELHANILEHLHYKAHDYAPYTTQARTAMSNMFQYKIVAVLEELISPIIAPYILVKHVRSRSLDIVDFFRNYSVEVAGTGDVCTFAMLNIKENGNPAWKTKSLSEIKAKDSLEQKRTNPVPVTFNDDLVTKNGKLELSLINFKLTNPSWNPYNESQQQFIQNVTHSAGIPEENESQEMNNSSSSATRSRTVPLTPPSSINNSVAEVEQNVISRERYRIINNLTDGRMSEPEERAAAMSISTLFLHQYISSPYISNNFRQQSECDPLLAPSSNSSRLPD